MAANKETGISTYRPSDALIKALEGAGLDHNVVELSSRILGPTVSQVFRRTLMSGLPAITGTQNLRKEPEYISLEEQFRQYVDGIKNEAQEVSPSQLPQLIGYGLTYIAHAAALFQTLNDLTLSQTVEKDEKKAQAYINALVSFLNGKKPQEKPQSKQAKPTGIKGLVLSWLNNDNQNAISPLDIFNEIASGTGWVIERDEMLKMFTAKFAINAYTLLQGKALLRDAAFAAKKDVDKALDRPAAIGEKLEPSFTKALQDLATAQAARDAAASALGAGEPMARAIALRQLAEAQKKLFALELIVDNYQRKMTAAEGAEKSAVEFARVEASGLRLLGKNVGEVAKTLQFDTITFLRAFGDIYACLTEATAEYNEEARIQIMNDYNARIALIPAQVESEVKALVTQDLKNIGAPSDINPKDVVEGTYADVTNKP